MGGFRASWEFSRQPGSSSIMQIRPAHRAALKPSNIKQSSLEQHEPKTSELWILTCVTHGPDHNTGDRQGTHRGEGGDRKETGRGQTGDRGTTERGWGTDTGRETQSGQMTNRTPRDTSLMNHFNHQGGLKDQAGNRWIAGSNPCPCRQQCVEQTPETSASLSTFRVHCPPASH